MTSEQRVTSVMQTCVKARSNAAELGEDYLTVSKIVGPRIYDTDEPLALINVCQRMLDKEEGPNAMDVFNLLSLCHRTEGFEALYFIMGWGDLPRPLSVLG